MKKSDGAISIFMIIITLSCFMLGGIFIDATRVLVAQNKVNLALDAAARSTMSYYDEDLVSEYGLYGVSEKKIDTNFKKYFKRNMLKAEYEGINLFEYTIYDEDTKMTGDKSFKSSMKEQIKEYEKYRMPVTTTLAVVERFKDAFSAMSGKANNLKGAGDAVEELNDRIKQAGKTLSTSGNAIKTNIKSTIKSNITTAAGNIIKGAAKDANTTEVNNQISIGIKSARDKVAVMRTELEELRKKRDKFRQEEEKLDEPSSLDEEKGGDQGAIAQGKAAEEKYKKVDENIDKEIESLEGEIKAVEDKITEIETNLYRMQSDLDTLIGNWQTAEAELSRAKESLQVAEANLEKVKEEKKITVDEKNAALLQKEINGIVDAIDELSMLLESDTVKDDYDEYKKAVDENDVSKISEYEKKYEEDEKISDILQQYKNKFAKEKELQAINEKIRLAKNAIKKEEGKVTECKNVVSAREEDVEKCKADITSKKDQMGQEIEKLGGIETPGIDTTVIKDMDKSEKSAFDSVEEDIFGGMYDLIDNIKKSMPKDEEDEDSSDETGLIAMFNSLMEEFENLVRIVTNPDAMVDQAMYVDYIMNKCTYLTSQSAKNHYFQYGEVEYILFGMKNQTANIAATIASIYGIRFTINFINYVITSPGGFISRLGGALARALAQSAIDISDMIIVPAGQDSAPGCNICPSVAKFKVAGALKLSYSDHLRLLLLMKFTDSDIDNLEDTMHYTLTKEMDAEGTSGLKSSATANVKVGVNLIMIPLFTDLLPLDNYFHNGQYIITTNCHYSY